MHLSTSLDEVATVDGNRLTGKTSALNSHMHFEGMLLTH
jgi:hypothetical protein